jgi:hypothetical protein
MGVQVNQGNNATWKINTFAAYEKLKQGCEA